MFSRRASPEPPRTDPWEGEFSPWATEEDILYCFRLLLGRRPNDRHEWGGHAWRVGEDLASLVRSYLSSEEFAARGLQARPLGQWELAELPHGKMFASREDHAIGRVILETGNYEPHVSRVFTDTLRPGMKVLDLGANIGFFSLLAASLVGPSGRVYSFEPSPKNVRVLCASQAANGFNHIQVIQAAASDKQELLRYFASSSNGNVGAVGGVRPEEILNAETVLALRVDDVIPRDERIDFVKIDVEGYELNALKGGLEMLKRCRPVMVSEFSPESLVAKSGVSGRGYLEFFERLGYELFVIAESGPIAGNIDSVLSYFDKAGSEHIDVLLRPR